MTERREDFAVAPLDAVVVLLALLPVGSLLAWVFGLGPFAVWFWAMSAPAMVGLALIGWRATRDGMRPRLRLALTAGFVGGLLGTFGYDVFRLPFHLFGLRLLAPIDSYGVLLLGARHSSDVTGLAGWAYHVSNGVGFGIAYAVVALHRRWWWGVLWAMVLETATIATPFVSTYALRGKWGIIAIAYAAHVCYGVPLGRWVEGASERVPRLSEVTRRPVVAALACVVAGLVVWHHPWASIGRRSGRPAGVDVVVRNDRFVPRWVRIGVGDCIVIRQGGSDARKCFDDKGVRRVRTSDRPDAGGFVIVDPEV